METLRKIAVPPFMIIKGLDFLSPAVDLAARLWLANVFWKSGLVKIASWESTLMLFNFEYQVPLLPPEVAAVLATAVELGGSVLLAFGLGALTTLLFVLALLGLLRPAVGWALLIGGVALTAWQVADLRDDLKAGWTALREVLAASWFVRVVILLGVAYALLNLIGGLDKPSSGTIEVAGTRIDRMDSGELAKWRAANVGFVFQFYNLLPMLSAQKNVELPLLLTRLSARDRKRNAAIALMLVGLADRAQHRPRELSGGQEQRVAIARAIVSDPKILVCDEPTGDLDRHTADEIMGLLQQLNREHGKTIVIVTHDPKAAEFAHRQLHLDKGTLAGNES